MQAHRGRLGQFEQGIAADCHAAEVEAALHAAEMEATRDGSRGASMTAHDRGLTGGQISALEMTATRPRGEPLY
jgi:hypothetical protein